MIDELLISFHYSLEEKQELMKILMTHFGNEFGINTDYRRQFGKMYRTYRSKIEQILKLQYDENNTETIILQPLITKSANIKTIVNEIWIQQDKDEVKDMLRSYIHMMLNRLFRTQQRKHELVIYDYLFRYYDSLIKRQKDEEKKTNSFTSF